MNLIKTDFRAREHIVCFWRRGFVILIAILILTSAFSFILGITLPLVHFQSFYIFEETPSLVEIVLSLFSDGNIGLAILVALVSILFPSLKLLSILTDALRRSDHRTMPAGGNQWLVLNIVPLLSKWSMMDVLLVALVIFGAKTTGFVSAVSQPGLWFYALSALASSFAHYLIKKDGLSHPM